MPTAMKDTDATRGRVGVSRRATNKVHIVKTGVNACGRMTAPRVSACARGVQAHSCRPPRNRHAVQLGALQPPVHTNACGSQPVTASARLPPTTVAGNESATYLEHLDEGHGEVEVHQVAKVQLQRNGSTCNAWGHSTAHCGGAAGAVSFAGAVRASAWHTHQRQQQAETRRRRGQEQGRFARTVSAMKRPTGRILDT